MHISNDIVQGIVMVNFDRMNCSPSRISQIRNCSAKTKEACSPVVIRFLSQHSRKTDPPFDRHFTTNKKICKRTNGKSLLDTKFEFIQKAFLTREELGT